MTTTPIVRLYEALSLVLPDPDVKIPLDATATNSCPRMPSVPQPFKTAPVKTSVDQRRRRGEDRDRLRSLQRTRR